MFTKQLRRFYLCQNLCSPNNRADTISVRTYVHQTIVPILSLSEPMFTKQSCRYYLCQNLCSPNNRADTISVRTYVHQTIVPILSLSRTYVHQTIRYDSISVRTYVYQTIAPILSLSEPMFTKQSCRFYLYHIVTQQQAHFILHSKIHLVETFEFNFDNSWKHDDVQRHTIGWITVQVSWMLKRFLLVLILTDFLVPQ